ncbi:hypothetical protein [Halodesulfovibrio aestuarii]|uniref:Uncharacterized protein n=1 Tax=Halodesulfovibrio aestuarii TaxID=126333 RepID=A0A8G2FC56_9BACT|nr:hypothetical protein [Halodesulfovibrio aestuarii]SHJ61250.1 hypothetical protein SAMN05660830_02835 [Halodesulfovibrio aestuarii]
MESFSWPLMTNLAVIICAVCFGLICAALVGIRSSQVALTDRIEKLTKHYKK